MHFRRRSEQYTPETLYPMVGCKKSKKRKQGPGDRLTMQSNDLGRGHYCCYDAWKTSKKLGNKTANERLHIVCGYSIKASIDRPISSMLCLLFLKKKNRVLVRQWVDVRREGDSWRLIEIRPNLIVRTIQTSTCTTTFLSLHSQFDSTLWACTSPESSTFWLSVQGSHAAQRHVRRSFCSRLIVINELQVNLISL